MEPYTKKNIKSFLIQKKPNGNMNDSILNSRVKKFIFFTRNGDEYCCLVESVVN